MRALSSAWTECLASDQVAAGSNPAAPIRFPNDLDSTDGVDFLLKKSLCARKSPFRFITGVVAVMRFASAKVLAYAQKDGWSPSLIDSWTKRSTKGRCSNRALGFCHLGRNDSVWLMVAR